MHKIVMLVAIGMVASAAMAAGDASGFKAADSNGDGAITRQEAASFSALELSFDAADLNGNGLIEREEYIRMKQADKEAAPRQ